MDIACCKLSEEAINMIKQVDSICNNVQDDEPSNPILYSLINDAKAEFESLVASQNTNILYANMELAELNDFSSTELATEKMEDVDVQISKDDIANILPNEMLTDLKNESERELDITVAECKKQVTVSVRQNFITHLSPKLATEKTEDIDVNKLNHREDSTTDDSNRIVQISKDDIANTLPNEMLTDLKNESEKELDIIVTEWKKQITLSDRQNFITNLSANPESILIFLSRIFTPWLRSVETISDAVQTLVGIVGCLTQQSVNVLFIPMFMEKECVLIKEDCHYLQDLFLSMTDSQKNHLLCSYLDEITELQNNDVHLLYKFIELTQLNENSIKSLLEQLLINVKHISNDRYLGYMLLLLAQQFSTNTPQEIIHLMAVLCNQFKGFMRYRIKNILKTVTGCSDN